jgi:hypothetical protein
MTLSEIIIFILVSSAITVVLARGFIFEAPKNWILGKVKSVYLDYLLTCPMCMGFWVGLILSFITNFKIYGLPVLDNVFAGFLCSAYAITLDRIIYRPDQKQQN